MLQYAYMRTTKDCMINLSDSYVTCSRDKSLLALAKPICMVGILSCKIGQ